MFRQNYIDALRTELVELVQDELTPLALHYGYSEVPLEVNIKWRPLVLVLGNYSSGKSTLINELLGADVQTTGQAPTDDSFTVITYDEHAPPGSANVVTEERDGKVLLHDPEFPFELLKKHGQRFAAHFRLKKVKSEFLRHFAIIDTPGMLDSIAERDRGYDYQEVIGDFAQIADLVLILFDPHKAGTVREAHASLRDTLPWRTAEDRILFVLNRIDECSNLNDLLRVYGTLCWNLSQMTGRKDIPMVRLTYSIKANGQQGGTEADRGYLKYLDNQREELREAISQAPKRRLDHLASYVETHSERLGHFLEALVAYQRRKRNFIGKYLGAGLLLAIILGGLLWVALSLTPLGADLQPPWQQGLAGAGAGLVFILWITFGLGLSSNFFHGQTLKKLDRLTKLNTQTRRDSWDAVKELVHNFLNQSGGRFKNSTVKQEYASVKKVYEKGSRDIREALNELSTIRHERPGP